MNPQDLPPCLEVATVGQVTVARFTREVVLSGKDAEVVGEHLRTLLAEPARRKLLLDFANVLSLSSLILGKLIMLNRVAESAAGKLALCNLRPGIREIMDASRLSLILYIYAEEQEALQSF
jgi:anti-sigma B factor antagonist